MWFLHDAAAPAYFSRIVRDVINSTYHKRWIGRRESIMRLPRSPDWNPLDFYLWGQKALAYLAPAHKVETLHQHIVNTCQTIRNYPGIFEQVWQLMIRCAQACIEPHRGYFEQFL
jgi:hypothetical protein